MLDPLVHIINFIFIIGKVPSSFKISIVIPVFKKGCKTNITNYRPISIISTFEKITGSSTYQILSDKQTDRQIDKLTETKDLIFRNLHSLKHEILKKSRRVIFFLLQYFPYVSKGSKKYRCILRLK